MTWHSTLTLGFDSPINSENSRTNLVQRHHQGALRVQKALYPEKGEQNGICHVIMLYPPAGIALGDKLDIEIGLQHHAHAVITTPGANKWYGNLPNYASKTQENKTENSKKPEAILNTPSTQNVNINLQDDSHIEWLPQENCFYNASHAYSTNQFFLSPNASLIAWEINLLGRAYHGETYNTGSMQLTNLLWRIAGDEHKLLLADTLSKSAEDDWFSSQVGLNNHTVFATLWAVPTVDNLDFIARWVKQLRVFIKTHDLPLTCTHTNEVFIIRYLGNHVRQCFDAFSAVRGEIRTFMWQKDNHLPRIWAT